MEEGAITSLLPHRPPFLFVDTIISADESKIVGVYTFSDQLEFFKGHFPTYPIVPGVILIEAMAQCGGAGLKALQKIENDQLFFLAMVTNVKFRAPVIPNTRVEFHVETIKLSSKIISQKGKTFIIPHENQEPEKAEKDKENLSTLAAEAEWKCFLSKKSI